MFLEHGKHPIQPANMPRTMHELGYRTVLLVHNPGSSLRRTTPAVIRRLEKTQPLHGLEIKTAETSPHLDDNRVMLQAETDDTTVVLVKAGDGGKSAIFTAGYSLGLSIPFGVLPGGHKNDMAHDLHDRQGLRRAEATLLRGRIEALHPIETIDYDGNTDVAWAYRSRGPSDQVAARVNDPAYRNRWLHKLPGATFIAEAAIARQELAAAQPYKVTIDGIAQEILEYMIINNDRMAGNLRSGTHLLERELAVIVVRNKLQAVTNSARMILGLRAGRKLTVDDMIVFRSPESGFSFQKDGDQKQATNGASKELTHRSAAGSINVVTTKQRR